MDFKGFLNNGENSCYINSVLQVLFHINGVKGLIASNSHSCEGCIECDMKALVFEYSSKGSNDSISLGGLRGHLAEYYSALGKFQINQPADSMEAFSAILEYFHYNYLKTNQCGSCNNECIAHKLFHIELIEQYVCVCSNNSEVLPWDYCTFSLQIYVDDLVKDTTDKRFLDFTGTNFHVNSETIKWKEKFAEYIRKQLLETHAKLCPDNPKCGYKRSNRRIYLIKASEVFVVNLTWEKIPTALKICKILASIKPIMNFQSISDINAGEFYLKGLIFYNSHHYISYVFDRVWHRCDDTIVRAVSSFKDVVQDVAYINYWPVAVFYDREPADYERLSNEDWMELEKNAMVAEIENEFNKFEAYWQCSCGTTNEDLLLYCCNCFKGRYFEFNWTCDRCGASNPEKIVICSHCQSSTLKPTHSSLHNQFFVSGLFNNSIGIDRTTSYQVDKPKALQDITRSQSIRINRIETSRFLPEESKAEGLSKEIGLCKTMRADEFIEKRVKAIASMVNFGIKCQNCGIILERRGDLCKKCNEGHIFCKKCGKVTKNKGEKCKCT